MQLFVVHPVFNLNAGPLSREDYRTCRGEVMVLFFPSLSVVQLTCPFEHVYTELLAENIVTEVSPRTGARRATDLEECKDFSVHDSIWGSLVLAGKNTPGAVSLHS